MSPQFDSTYLRRSSRLAAKPYHNGMHGKEYVARPNHIVPVNNKSEKTSTQNVLLRIPLELLIVILSHLPFKCKIKCASVCKLFHEIVFNTGVWRKLDLSEIRDKAASLHVKSFFLRLSNDTRNSVRVIIWSGEGGNGVLIMLLQLFPHVVEFALSDSRRYSYNRLTKAINKAVELKYRWPNVERFYLPLPPVHQFIRSVELVNAVNMLVNDRQLLSLCNCQMAVGLPRTCIGCKKIFINCPMQGCCKNICSTECHRYSKCIQSYFK